MCRYHGPTLNPDYNQLLLAWAEQGSPSPPECEECGQDLTDKQVYDTETLWVCKECYDNVEDPPFNVGYREDFHSDG